MGANERLGAVAATTSLGRKHRPIAVHVAAACRLVRHKRIDPMRIAIMVFRRAVSPRPTLSTHWPTESCTSGLVGKFYYSSRSYVVMTTISAPSIVALNGADTLISIFVGNFVPVDGEFRADPTFVPGAFVPPAEFPWRSSFQHSATVTMLCLAPIVHRISMYR